MRPTKMMILRVASLVILSSIAFVAFQAALAAPDPLQAPPQTSQITQLAPMPSPSAELAPTQTPSQPQLVEASPTPEVATPTPLPTANPAPRPSATPRPSPAPTPATTPTPPINQPAASPAPTQAPVSPTPTPTLPPSPPPATPNPTQAPTATPEPPPLSGLPPVPTPSPLPEPQPTEPEPPPPTPTPTLGAIENACVRYGLLTWDALPHATGYAVAVEQGGETLHDFAATDDTRVLDLYALDLPLGDYALTLRALGGGDYEDSPVLRLGYRETMIRDVEVRANFNFGRAYDDEQDYWLQHFLDFNLKRGMVFDMPSVAPEHWNDAYTAFLAGNPSEKSNAAAAIGNDIMVTYYYLNDAGAPVALQTTSGAPFVKNKLWGGWLWRRVGESYAQIDGEFVPPFSVGGVVPQSTALRVSANIGNRNPAGGGTAISSTQLEEIRGRTLYVDIDVILRDGSTARFYKETAALEVPNW